MQKILPLLFVFAVLAAFGQETKTTDEDAVFLIIEDVEDSRDFNVKAPDGTELFYLAYHTFCNLDYMTRTTDPYGKDSYYEVIFYHDKQRCEIRNIRGTTEGITRWVIDNELVQDGIVNQAVEDKLVLINANRYSKNSTTIVINH